MKMEFKNYEKLKKIKKKKPTKFLISTVTLNYFIIIS